MTPFFRPVAAPYPTNLPSMRRSCAPCFHFLENFCIFNHVVAKLQFSRPKFFPTFVPKTPIFQGKSASLTLHFETRVAHTHQKKVECPRTYFEFVLWQYMTFLKTCLRCVSNGLCILCLQPGGQGAPRDF